MHSFQLDACVCKSVNETKSSSTINRSFNISSFNLYDITNLLSNLKSPYLKVQRTYLNVKNILESKMCYNLLVNPNGIFDCKSLLDCY